MNPTGRVWGVLPAAGVGRRMGTAIPKQYLPLRGRRVIEWSLDVIAGADGVAGVTIAMDPADDHWEPPARAGVPVQRVDGGAERADSVRAALDALVAGGAAGDDRVLVHDAVRPCVSPAAVTRLLAQGVAHADGALLAVPVPDTLKRGTAEGLVAETISRDGLWQAQTPQLFPLEALRAALTAGREQAATDEAQAMERTGARPRLVEGETGNLKITRPGDLEMAAAILAAARGEGT